MSAITIPEPEASVIDRSIRSFVSPGATLSGEQRRSLAEISRASMADPDLIDRADPLESLAVRFTVAAHTLRSNDVAAAERDGIPVATYVEVLGLVARLVAVDTFCFAVGADAPVLPSAAEGGPTGVVATEATIDGGWVPTVGPAWPPSALSLIPAEDEALHDLHGVFYLSMEGMADFDADRGLHRTQMELVAARTSLLNECFF
ncbi:MAG: hypothetical protein GY925_13505 [Actinomycetia bacterium]|nr:hypothetical protein [Actinomycetes bacterium]